MLLPECGGPDFEAGALEYGETMEVEAECVSIDTPFFVGSVEFHAVDAAGDDVLASQSGAEPGFLRYWKRVVCPVRAFRLPESRL